jgi:hypothetical protein
MYEWWWIIFGLWQTTSLCQMLPSDFEVIFLTFHENVIQGLKENVLITYWAKYSSTGNASVFQYTIQLHHWWCRYKIIEISDNEKSWVTVIMIMLADGKKKVPPYMTQNCNTTHKAQLPMGLIIFSPVAVKIWNAWIVKSCLEQGTRSIVLTIWHACEESNQIYSSCNKCWPCGLTCENDLTFTTSTCYNE